MCPMHLGPGFEPYNTNKRVKNNLQNTGLRCLTFGMWHGVKVFYQVCSNGGPGSNIAQCQGVLVLTI